MSLTAIDPLWPLADSSAFGVRPSWDLVADWQMIWQYHFMHTALAAAALVALVAGAAGYFMVLRGQTFAGHALSHVGFTGAAGALLIGVSPLMGLVVFGVAAALGMVALGDRFAQRSEIAIGTVLALSLGLGLLFVRLYPAFADGAYAILFGAPLGISDVQLAGIALAAIVSLVVLAAIARPLLFASVVPDVAQARGVPVQALGAIFLVTLAIAVAIAAQVVGVLLIFALLVAPAAAAQHLTARPALGAALAVGLSLACAWLGLAIGYFAPVPVSSIITTLAFTAYIVARGVRLWRERPGARSEAHA